MKYETFIYESDGRGRTVIFAEHEYANLDVAKKWVERYFAMLPHLACAEINVLNRGKFLSQYTYEHGQWRYQESK